MPIIFIFLLILIYVIFFLWVTLLDLENTLKVALTIEMGNITFLHIIKEAKID